MQKKIIALAVAGLVSGVAYAQSTVTISGNVEMGYYGSTFEFKDKSVGGVNTKRTASGFHGAGSSQNGGDASAPSSSYIRLETVEGLGNGLKAGFTYEMGITSLSRTGDNIDEDPAPLTRLRQGVVFLDGGFGRVSAGYKDVLESQLNGVGNSFTGNLGNANGISGLGFGRAFNSTAKDWDGSRIATTNGIHTGDTSRANMFEYASPVFSGAQVLAQWGRMKTDWKNWDEVEGRQNDTQNTFWSVGGKYNNGPLALAAVYAKEQYENSFFTAPNAITNDTDKRTWGLFANYDFKVAKVFFSYADRKVDGDEYRNGVVRSDDSLKYRAYDLGLSVPVGERVSLMGNYGWGKLKGKDKLTDDSGNFKVRAYQLGARYEFTKRTSMTAYFARTSWDGGGDVSDIESKGHIIGATMRHSF